MDNKAQALNKEILNATSTGEFYSKIQDIYLSNEVEDGVLAKTLIELHNTQKIDVINEFRQLTKTLDGIDFYINRYTFEEILPQLNISTEDAIACGRHLEKESGNEGGIFPAFSNFFSADEKRVKEFFELFEANSSDYIDFLSTSLIAGTKHNLDTYISKAIELLDSTDSDIKRIAIFALGHIDYQDNTVHSKQAFAALESLYSTDIDDVIASVIFASCFRIQVTNTDFQNKFIQLAKLILSRKETQILHEAATRLAFDFKDLSKELLELLIDALPHIKPESKGTINQLDIGLRNLVRNKQLVECGHIVDNIMVSHYPNIKIQEFDSFIYELFKEDQQALHYFITRWFMSQKSTLCLAASDVIKFHRSQNAPIKADLKQIQGKPFGIRTYLARKAIGWFITQSVTSASYIASLLENALVSEAKDLAALLYDPILLNYSGSAKEYLESIVAQKSEPVAKLINEQLQLFKDYQENLASIGRLPELEPPASHRESYYRLFNEQMSEAYKDANKGSLIDDLIGVKKVLLYGRSTINYIHSPDGKRHRTENQLQSVSHSMEIPRLEHIDPNGMEYMLRIFRSEGLTP